MWNIKGQRFFPHCICSSILPQNKLRTRVQRREKDFKSKVTQPKSWDRGEGRLPGTEKNLKDKIGIHRGSLFFSFILLSFLSLIITFIPFILFTSSSIPFSPPAPFSPSLSSSSSSFSSLSPYSSFTSRTKQYYIGFCQVSSLMTSPNSSALLQNGHNPGREALLFLMPPLPAGFILHFS